MATWRDHPYSYQGYLFLLKPTPVFKARVNMSSISYPWQRLTYDTVTLGAYTDIEPGMTVLLGTSEGADDLGRNRTRWTYEGMVADEDTIYVGQFSRGVKDGEFDVEDNAYITVLDDYRVWAKIPRVTNDGVVYKDYKLQYSDCEPQPPVANAGVGYAEFIDPDTEVITVDFDGSASFAVAAGASISSYAWDFADGTPSTGDTAQVSDVTFPAGFRWVKLTVTDSNGQAHTARVPVFAAETSGSNAPITRFEVVEQVLSSEGQHFSVRIYEDIDLSDYPDGTLIMYWEREVHGGVAGSLTGPTGREHMKFIGWLDTDEAEISVSEAGALPGVTLNCVDVGGRLRQLPGFPFVLERDSAPTKWSQLKTLNIDRYLWFILLWHSTALELADFTWSGTGETYAVPVLGSDGASLWEQTDGRAQAIAHRLTCDRFGRLAVRPDPLLQDSGDRTATVITDIDESDWAGTLTYTHQRPPRVHWLWGEAIQAQAADADAIEAVTPLFCVAPGKAPGQGVQETNQGEQVVADQMELNAREGHRYAARHNAEEGYFELELAHAGDSGIDPALMQWVRLTISAQTAAQRGLTFTDERFLPTEMTIEHDHEAQTKRVSLTLQRERVGTPAATYIPPTGEFEQWEDLYPDDYGYVYPEVGEFWLKAGLGALAMFDDKSYVYITADHMADSPTWTRIFANLLGKPVVFIVHAFSPGYVGGGSAINGWLVTTRAIYGIFDIFGASPDFVLQYDYGYEINPSGAGMIPSMIGGDASFGTPNHVVVVIPQNANGYGPCKVLYTVDGANWTAVNLGTTSGTMTWVAAGVYVSPRTPGLVYITVLDTDGYTAHNYISTNYGQTWARMYSHGPRHPYMQYLNLRGSVCIHVPYDDNPDEDDLYYIRHNTSNNDSMRVRRIVSGIDIDITPNYLGKNSWGPTRARWGLMTAPLDRNQLAMIAQTLFENHYLFTSSDQGTSWSVYGPTSARRVAIAGDDPDALYLWGADGYIAYSPDFGMTIQNKMGNMGSFDPAPGEIIGICGGPTT